MTRFVLGALATFVLLVPTVTSAQGVKTIYRPEVHGTIIVVPQASVATVAPAEKAAPTPLQVIARHQPMADAYRLAIRVSHSAVAHCERAVAKARAELRKNL